jgi:2'-5' RNA ligase
MAAGERMRLFVAIFPPPEVIESLADAIRRLSGLLPPEAVTWTGREKIHLTLNFLGGTDPLRMERLEGMLEAICQTGRRHLLQARGVGCFPNMRRPRIIWAGLPEPPPGLASLKEKLDQGLKSLAFPTEDRPFHPHLTIGRVKELDARHRHAFTDKLRAWSAAPFGQWAVTKIDLMQSVLFPKGASYSVLRSFPLGGSDLPQ